MITGVFARYGLYAMLPVWLGKWDRVEIAAKAAGTSAFELDFPDAGLPVLYFAVAVKTAEGKRKACRKLMRAG